MNKNPALDKDLSSRYQSLNGMLRWMLEIGRVGIITEVENDGIPDGHA